MALELDDIEVDKDIDIRRLRQIERITKQRISSIFQKWWNGEELTQHEMENYYIFRNDQHVTEKRIRDYRQQKIDEFLDGYSR